MPWSDLTPEAHILYSSDSVIDILGYTPDEIVNRSAWNFFSKDELPYAQEFHRKRVVMDTAAVLAYCNVLAKDGSWITCECCFTIVYDVMIVCTSIYQRGGKSDSKWPERAGTTDTTLTPLFRPRNCRTHRQAHLFFLAKGPTISHAFAYLVQILSASQTCRARTTSSTLLEPLHPHTNNHVRHQCTGGSHRNSRKRNAWPKLLLLHCRELLARFDQLSGERERQRLDSLPPLLVPGSQKGRPYASA